MTDDPAKPDILADLAAEPRRFTGPVCVRVRIERDHPELLENWYRALASNLTAEQIADWFTDHGVTTGGHAVFNHRNGKCDRCRNNPTS